jgi:hypothetical protein
MTDSTKQQLTPTLSIARRAVDRVETIAVHVWVHDRAYGLVADANEPHGFRLVGSADTIELLEDALTLEFRMTGKL